jgi:hypothetical protein
VRFLSRRRAGVSSIVGSIFFVLIMIVAIASLVTIFNSFTSYNSQVNKASNSNLQAGDTDLAVTGGQFGAIPPSSPSNFNVATACTATSTSPTNREKVFYAASMWWDFYTCNSAYQYSTSYDGVTWSAATSIPYVITSGYTVGPYFDVEVVGTAFYLAIAKVGSPDFQLGIGTLASGGTDSAPAGTITWTEAPATVVAGATNALGPINMAVDGAGNQWIALVQGTCTTAVNCNIGIYEHQTCATASTAGWEPNSCTSTTSPTNYAPAALTGLSVNTHTIFFPAMSSYSATGVVLLYEYGSATVSTIGTLGMVTQTALATTTWNTITLTGIGAYSLSASSGAIIGTTFYFAGLTGTVGATTGSLDFWSVAFTSMSAGTPSTQTVMEAIGLGSIAWQAALTYSGSTLVLFDTPPASIDSCPAGDNCIQYYTTGTLGTLWSSAILLDSSETAVNGLSPASGAIAVTWVGATPFNVRFAALSTFTLTNTSPFAVHVVDLYIYNPATNSLVAHWYYNTTEDFDYWIGQGGTMAIPIRFAWAADTSYLITFSTDTGATAQTTLTTLPGGIISCPSSEFFSQISPTDACGTVGGTTNPLLISGAGAAKCTDTTSGTALMMGLGLSYTTSASTSGNIFLNFAFQVTSPATSGVTSTWQLYYGAGSSPACNSAATGTPLGQAFIVQSQAAVVRGEPQSVSTTISGLSPSTTYWFDVQATDSTAGAWIYSLPDMGITEVQATNAPTLSTSTNTKTCSDTTTTTAQMMGFATTFATGGAGFTGTEFGQLSFNLALASATSAITTKYTVTYGTGTAPACNAAASGTTTAEQYTFTSQAAVIGGAGQKVGFVLTGLTASTTYWVDVQASDSTAATWTYSNPVLAVMNMPTAGANSIPSAASSANVNTCTDTTATTLKMAGFGVEYNVPSSAVGNLYLTLTFQVGIPATSAVSTQWQIAWDTGSPPICNGAPTGYTPDNTYTVASQSATVGGFSVSDTFVIQDVHQIAGTTIWVDVQVSDSTGANWVYSNPTLAVAMFPY